MQARVGLFSGECNWHTCVTGLLEVNEGRGGFSSGVCYMHKCISMWLEDSEYILYMVNVIRVISWWSVSSSGSVCLTTNVNEFWDILCDPGKHIVCNDKSPSRHD